MQNGLIPSPFNIRVSTLVKKEYESEIELVRNGNPHDLKSKPTSNREAIGACLSYLKGTSVHERGRAEAQVRKHKEFKELGKDNFRTKDAQEIRDKYLNNKVVGFLHQAFRYRGKANYRDALYLGYGTEHTDLLRDLLQDLYSVLSAFIRASAYYCSRRVEKNTWDNFVQDLEGNCKLKLSTDILRV